MHAPFFSMSYASAGSYVVHVTGHALAGDGLPVLVGRARTLLVVSPTVRRLHGPALEAFVSRTDGQVDLMEAASGERAKRWSAVERICEAALDARLERGAQLVAIGG